MLSILLCAKMTIIHGAVACSHSSDGYCTTNLLLLQIGDHFKQKCLHLEMHRYIPFKYTCVKWGQHAPLPPILQHFAYLGLVPDVNIHVGIVCPSPDQQESDEAILTYGSNGVVRSIHGTLNPLGPICVMFIYTQALAWLMYKVYALPLHLL